MFDRTYRVGFVYRINAKGEAQVMTPDFAPAYIYRREEKQADEKTRPSEPR